MMNKETWKIIYTQTASFALFLSLYRRRYMSLYSQWFLITLIQMICKLNPTYLFVNFRLLF